MEVIRESKAKPSQQQLYLISGATHNFTRKSTGPAVVNPDQQSTEIQEKELRREQQYPRIRYFSEAVRLLNCGVKDISTVKRNAFYAVNNFTMARDRSCI